MYVYLSKEGNITRLVQRAWLHRQGRRARGLCLRRWPSKRFLLVFPFGRADG